MRRQFADVLEGQDIEPEVLGDDFEGGADFDWDAVPAGLAGDADIAFLWRPAADGIGDLDDPVNRGQGIGDYRAGSWHQPFDRYKVNPDAPSALY